MIQSQGIIAYADPAIRLAISRAIATESSRGWKIDKAKQAHKIDVVVALAMACHAAVQGQGEDAPFNQNYAEWMGDGGQSELDAWRALNRHYFIMSGGNSPIVLREPANKQL